MPTTTPPLTGNNTHKITLPPTIGMTITGPTITTPLTKTPTTLLELPARKQNQKPPNITLTHHHGTPTPTGAIHHAHPTPFITLTRLQTHNPKKQPLKSSSHLKNPSIPFKPSNLLPTSKSTSKKKKKNK